MGWFLARNRPQDAEPIRVIRPRDRCPPPRVHQACAGAPAPPGVAMTTSGFGLTVPHYLICRGFGPLLIEILWKGRCVVASAPMGEPFSKVYQGFLDGCQPEEQQ